MTEHETPCTGLARMEAEVSNLKEWQSKQNGTLQKLDDKIDGQLGDLVQAQRDQVQEQRKNFYGLGVAILLLAANIVLNWK